MKNPFKLEKLYPKKVKPQKQLPKYQKKPKQYCCLYHETNGKATKGITPCLHHVANGIINPITTLNQRELQILQQSKTNKNKPIQNFNDNLEVDADQMILNYHTHYLNQINKRGSLPKKLVNPNVYVEKVIKNKRPNKPKQNYVYTYTGKYAKVHYSLNQFQVEYREIQKYFKLFAAKTNFKSLEEFTTDLESFYEENKIKNIIEANSLLRKSRKNIHLEQQCLFAKEQFINYLKSHGFVSEQAERFWDLIYNQNTFKLIFKKENDILSINSQFISMKSFGYNFRRYYLELQKEYHNMFSDVAFRQRLVDLRLFLQNWFYRNDVLKQKLKRWKNNQLDLLSYLKDQSYDQEYYQICDLYQAREQTIFSLDSIAETVFELTDKKNFGFDVWNDQVTYLIEQKTNSLICFLQFVTKYKEYFPTKLNLNESETININMIRFKLSQMVEFLNQIKTEYDMTEERWIMEWLSKIYRFLYFDKNYKGLQFDQKTCKLFCKQSIDLSLQILDEFMESETIQNDSFLELINDINSQIEQVLAEIPQLKGHNKKYLLECNYIAQTLIKIIKRKNFQLLQILFQIDYLLEQGRQNIDNVVEEILEVLKSSNQVRKYNIKKSSLSKGFADQQKFWQVYFTFEEEGTFKKRLIEKYSHKFICQNKLNEQKFSNFTNRIKCNETIQKFQSLKQKLGIKNSKQKKQFNMQKQLNQLKGKKQIEFEKNKVVKKSQEANEQLTGKNKANQINYKNVSDSAKQSNEYHLSLTTHDEYNLPYCLDLTASTSISSTISHVQVMSSYLDDLLKGVSYY